MGTRSKEWMSAALLWLGAAGACFAGCSSSSPPAHPAESEAPPTFEAGSPPDAKPPPKSQPGGAVCAAIENLRVSSSSAALVSLAWSGAPGVTISIARKTYCGSDGYRVLATLPAGASSYTDTSVEANWAYWYEITTNKSATGVVASTAVGAWASTTSSPDACPGGNPPQPSSVAPSACADSGAPDASPPSAMGYIESLDCVNSTQPAICSYVSKTAVPQSAPATLSPNCLHPTNTVEADPSNFMAVTASVVAGQTVLFQPGTYMGEVSLVSGVNYCGQGGDPTKVVFENPGWVFFASGSVSNVVIDGVTLESGGIGLGNGGDTLYVQNSVIDNVPGGGQGSVWLAGVSNVTVAQNRLRLSGAINTWAVDHVTIADNSFSACDEGMHINYPGTTANVRIARNTFVEGHRIMIEIQAGDSNMLVEDNAIVFPNMGGYPDTYGMGISLAIPGSTGAVVRNNWLFGPVGNYQTLGVLALELAGTNTQVTGNVMQYWNAGTSISYNGPTMTLNDNSYCDVLTFLTEDGGFNGWPGVDSDNSCVKGASGYASAVP
jgi:Right handed beta helix region